jgi:hypothetical protein
MTTALDILSEIDELKGRLTLITVQYPDTERGLQDSIDFFGQLLIRPKPGMVQEAIVHLQEIKQYLTEIAVKYPETKKELIPAIKLADGLLGPTVH